jgi:pimeloyl-ACP methyl ester carboxylesterase
MIELTRTSDINGACIAWDRWGPDTGMPLLLVHGFSGSAHDFALRVPELSADRPVVALDHRGHGLSTKFEATDAYSIDILTNDLETFVDTQIGGTFDMLGHSMGGRIAMQLTLARPELVRSLILMDTTSNRFIDEESPVAALLGQFMSTFDPADGLPDFWSFESDETALIEAAATPQWQTVKESRSAAFDPYAMKALGAALFGPELEPLTDRLGEIDGPLTVLAGEHDHPFVDHPDEIAAASGGIARVIDGAYHSPQLTHADLWLEVVESHLNAFE